MKQNQQRAIVPPWPHEENPPAVMLVRNNVRMIELCQATRLQAIDGTRDVCMLRCSHSAKHDGRHQDNMWGYTWARGKRTKTHGVRVA